MGFVKGSNGGKAPRALSSRPVGPSVQNPLTALQLAQGGMRLPFRPPADRETARSDPPSVGRLMDRKEPLPRFNRRDSVLF